MGAGREDRPGRQSYQVGKRAELVLTEVLPVHTRDDHALEAGHLGQWDPWQLVFLPYEHALQFPDLVLGVVDHAGVPGLSPFTKPRISRAKPSGSSRCTLWPAPAITSRRDPAIPA